MEKNCIFVSWNIEDAKNGDLLFYERPPDEGGASWHSMIYLSPDQYDDAFVVYHTGPIGTNIPNGTGEIRKVKFEELLNHPDTAWRPIKNNDYFKGIFRWKIVQ